MPRSQSDRLLRITAAIADAVSSAQVFEALVDQVGDALGASTAALWLVPPGGTTAILARAFGYSDATKGLFTTVPLDGQAVPVNDAIGRGVPVWISSQQDLLRQYPNLAGAVTPGREYRVACLPVITERRTVGALGFSFDARGGWGNEDERGVLALVVRHAGQALERLRLFEAEQASRAEAEAAAARMSQLYAMARAVIGASDVAQVFEAALDAIASGLGTDRASVLVFDDEGVMRFRAWRGLSERYRRAVEGHSPWTRDARDPKPILVPDVAADHSLARYGSLFHDEGIGALGFIPLVADGHLLGKFMVYYPEPRALAPRELDLARAIADHVAAAISRFSAVSDLERAVRFNELFTGIVGHDLRNPLASIVTSAKLAEKRLEGQGEHLTKPLGRILRSSERMSRMIDQLLDFTRVRLRGGMPLRRQPVDLPPLVRHVMDELDDAHPAWTLRLEQLGDCRGQWDADRLSQVFSNLVGNALEHGAPEGGLQITLDGRDGAAVTAEVRNRGAIAPEVLPGLFEPLAGGTRRLPGSRGLGLGLYISNEIVRAHGGALSVRSEGNDTTFVVVLPRRRGEGQP